MLAVSVRPAMNRAVLIGLAVQALLPFPAFAQGRSVVHAETYWQERSSCQVRSLNYTGPCMLTVISFGKSMNIHFDIDKMGSMGLSFGGNQFFTTSHGAVLQVMGVTERFNGTDHTEIVDGECAVEFAGRYNPMTSQKLPWDKTTRIICVSADGRFNGTAE